MCTKICKTNHRKNNQKPMYAATENNAICPALPISPTAQPVRFIFRKITFETAHMIRKGQFQTNGLTAFQQFAALAA
jgi:hypothetical protein